MYYAVTGLCYAASTIVGGAVSDRFGDVVFTLGGAELDYYAAMFLFGWITRMLGAAVLLWVVEEPRRVISSAASVAVNRSSRRANRARNAGTRIVRMTNVSSSTPSAKAKPSSCIVRNVPVIIAANVPAMMTPQLVMMPPVRTTATRSPSTGPSRRCSSNTRVAR